MIAKEMETILAFDCKYVDRVEKRTYCCIKHLQTKGNHGIRDREGEASSHVYGRVRESS